MCDNELDTTTVMVMKNNNNDKKWHRSSSNSAITATTSGGHLPTTTPATTILLANNKNDVDADDDDDEIMKEDTGNRMLNASSSSSQPTFSANHFPNYHHHHHHHHYDHNHHHPRIINFMTPYAVQHRPGPDMARLMELLERNDCILELSNGQRKYGKPAPPSPGPEPPPLPGNTEIFVGKIPKDLFEDELVPLFEIIAPIYNLRLMMDPLTGLSRGYAFITFFQPEHARSAVEKFDNYELSPGVHLKVKMSIPNVRLFIGNISKEMTKEDIRYEFQKHTSGLVDVIVYHSPHDRNRNRGFCFLEYESHKQASQAKRKLLLHRTKIWDSEIWVDWAEPLEQPNEEIMSRVKVLYVRNLSLAMTDPAIAELFQRFGTIERVKKIKDYAFVHFEERRCAMEAMKQMNGKIITPGGMPLEISLAKPPTDKRRKEEILRNREKRLMNMMHTRLASIIDNNVVPAAAAAAAVCNHHQHNHQHHSSYTATFPATAMDTTPAPPPPPPPPSILLSNTAMTGPELASMMAIAAAAAASTGPIVPPGFYIQTPNSFPIYHPATAATATSISPVARVTVGSTGTTTGSGVGDLDRESDFLSTGSQKSSSNSDAMADFIASAAAAAAAAGTGIGFDPATYCFYENCPWCDVVAGTSGQQPPPPSQPPPPPPTAIILPGGDVTSGNDNNPSQQSFHLSKSKSSATNNKIGNNVGGKKQHHQRHGIK